MKIKGLQLLVKALGVCGRTVRNWRDQGAPITKDYEADLAEVHLWRAKKKGGGGDARQRFLSPQRGKDFQEERLKRAQADLKEMEVSRERGELVPLREVEKMFVARILACKQGLLSLSRALPPQLVICQTEREMEPVIKKAVDDLLNAFARPLPEQFQGGAQ